MIYRGKISQRVAAVDFEGNLVPSNNHSRDHDPAWDNGYIVQMNRTVGSQLMDHNILVAQLTFFFNTLHRKHGGFSFAAVRMRLGR
jgi:hypothetical protein